MKISVTHLVAVVLSTQGAFAQQKINENIKVTIQKQDVLNSRFHETNLSITPSGNTIFFMSDRPATPADQAYESSGHMRYDSDIWYSVKSGQGWTAPKNVGAPAGSENNEDEPMVTPDGTTVFFQSWRDEWESTGGPYYSATLSGTRWGRPMGMGSGINRFFRDMNVKYSGEGTDGAALSPDGRKFIFAWGPDYYGDMDIYMSVKQAGGAWSYPKKLSISTAGNERSVFFGADSKTLFFGSDGYKGSGGLDIYKTIINEDGTHGEILNMGPQFNSSGDDYGFILTADGKEAYFGRNGDIYKATIENPPAEILPDVTALVRGVVKSDAGKPLHAKLNLVDAATGKIIETKFTDAGKGTYSFYINDARNKYTVDLIWDHAELYKEPVKIKPDAAYSEVTIDFTITEKKEEVISQPVTEKPVIPVMTHEARQEDAAIGSNGTLTIATPDTKKRWDSVIVKEGKVIHRVHFSNRFTNLSPDAQFKLYYAMDNLKNTKGDILISAFGEPMDDPEFNEKVAMERALTVLRFLIEHGIPEERLLAEFYPRSYYYPKFDKIAVLNIRRADLTLVNREDLKNMGDRRLLPVDSLVIHEDVFNFNEANIEDLKEFEEYIRRNPEEAPAFLKRGILHAVSGNHDEALTDLNKAISLGAESKDAFYFRGVVHETIKKYDEALKDFDTTISHEPENASLYVHRGKVKLQLGDQRGACADFKIAEKFQPGITEKIATNCR